MNLKSIFNFTKAITTGSYVSEEIQKERQLICSKCANYRIDKLGFEHCGICGCSVSPDVWKLINLTAYVENLPEWGCKHRLRNRGFGWNR